MVVRSLWRVFANLLKGQQPYVESTNGDPSWDLPQEETGFDANNLRTTMGQPGPDPFELHPDHHTLESALGRRSKRMSVRASATAGKPTVHHATAATPLPSPII